MGVCALPDCEKTYGKCRLFTFPKEETRRSLWISRCYLTSVGPNARLCEAHFDDSQFELNRKDGWKRLKLDAVPTLFPEPVRVFKMNIINGEPTEIVEIIQDKSRKRKSETLENEIDFKLYSRTEKCLELPDFSNIRNLQPVVELEELPLGCEMLKKAIAKSEKNHLLDDLDHSPRIQKTKSKGIVNTSKNVVKSKIIKNARPSAAKRNASNDSPLLAPGEIKIQPEDEIQHRFQTTGSVLMSDDSITDSAGETTESDEDTTEGNASKKHSKAKRTKRNDPQLILMKQWNQVLKDELVELRQKNKTETLKNEILLNDKLELENELKNLKPMNKVMNASRKELEKENKRLKREVDVMERDKKEFQMEKLAFKELVIELTKDVKKLMSENDDMKLTVRGLRQELERLKNVTEENNKLKHENNTLENDVKKFEKHNKDMSEVISELEQHNKLLNEKLLELLQAKCKGTVTIDYETEVLQTQVKDLKAQNQAMITENACMLEEIQQFITRNKDLHKTITELETRNTAISYKLKETEEENKTMSNKIRVLENQIKDLTKDELPNVCILQCLN